MSWVRVDDKAWSHPKFASLSGNAVKLWLFALCWSNGHETDGHIPTQVLRILGGNKSDAAALCAAGLWIKIDAGWEIHDFLKYQPSAEENRRRREAKAEAGRTGGLRSAQARGQAKPKQNPSTCLDSATTSATTSGSNLANQNPTPNPDPNPIVSKDTFMLSSDVTRNVRGSHASSGQVTPGEPKPKRRKMPMTEIPPDWAPTETHRAKCRSSGIDCDREAERFRNSAAAKGRQYANWNAAFSTWIDSPYDKIRTQEPTEAPRAAILTP